MLNLVIALWVFAALWTDGAMAQPVSPDDVYTTRAVVTGKDERNRPLGFKLCFEDVLVKASGDSGVVNDRRIEALATSTGKYISTFSYRDLLEGKPTHDDQGSYDRPHFLTCHFDPKKIDGVLRSLGRKPWPVPRPRLAMVLVVHGRKNSGILSSDGTFDADMREALANAARRYGLMVNLPTIANLGANEVTVKTAANTSRDRLLKIAAASDSELTLVGDLQWSDAALGWIAVWRLKTDRRGYRWSVRGVNYDEAFRNAVRGAARVLSRNGKP
jgi:hypothetical protein